MVKKLQETGFRKKLAHAVMRLDGWSFNPWRRYSLFLIIFFIGFSLGSSLGMINGVLALMDPIGALSIVFILELIIRFRRVLIRDKARRIILNILDILRIGLIYGLFTEAFKLL